MSDIDKKDQALTSEYHAVVSYHTSLVQSRFTIASFYIAGMAFLFTQEFNKDPTIHAKIGICCIAIWITICTWILELRSRSLYANVARRGIEIEHYKWGLLRTEWYSGFFSRQYKFPPQQHDHVSEVPSRPGPDPVSISLPFWHKPLTMGPWFSSYITHSRGFDLLYFGSIVIWLILLYFAIQYARHSLPLKA